MLLSRTAALLALILVLSGCKIVVQVPIGGEVSTESGAFSCAEETICEIDVVDLFFDETFVAEANSDRVFDHWMLEDRHLCGDTKLDCQLSTASFENSELLMSILTSDETFTLRPVFSDPYDYGNSGNPFAPPKHPSVRLPGTWEYSQKWGSCSASGGFERDEGVIQVGSYWSSFKRSTYPTYSLRSVYEVGSQIVTGIEPCTYYTVVNDTSDAILVAPQAGLSEFELEELFSESSIVQVLNQDQYRKHEMREGAWQTFTYKRVQVPGLTIPCQLGDACPDS